MLQAVRQRVIIQAGGKVELVSPDLTAGREAEVIVIEEPRSRARPLASYVGIAPKTFASPEEVNDYLRRQRDEWE